MNRLREASACGWILEQKDRIVFCSMIKVSYLNLHPRMLTVCSLSFGLLIDMTFQGVKVGVSSQGNAQECLRYLPIGRSFLKALGANRNEDLASRTRHVQPIGSFLS